VIINLNAVCEFVVTKAGADIWNARYAHLANILKDYKPTEVKAGDTVKSQLWIVMETFGPFICMGMSEVPFQDNNITVIDQ
jgi:hypothetical protein